MHLRKTIYEQKNRNNEYAHMGGGSDFGSSKSNAQSADSVRHVEGVVVDAQGRLAGGGGPKIMGYDLKSYAIHFAPKSLPGKTALALFGVVTFPLIAAILLMLMFVLGMFGLGFMLLGPFTTRKK